MKNKLLGMLAVAALLISGCTPTTTRGPLPSVAEHASERYLEYRGFTVDLTLIRDFPNRTEIIDSIKHQVDIVADCGVPEGVQKFFRRQTIGLERKLEHGEAKRNRIYLAAVVEYPQKPVLLHEMLHMFHFQVLPGGERNVDVIRFFKRAKEANLYARDAWLLTNEREFFAMTASVFLHGTADREPLSRERLKHLQPQYYDWLVATFGVRY